MTARTMRSLTLIAFAATVCALSVSCDGGPEDDRLHVAVSVPPQAWLVERLGGSNVRVTTLIGPGDSPHSYQPSDLEITEVMRSRVYIRIGVSFEDGPWFDALSGRPDLRIVDAREGIALRAMAGHDHEEEGHGHGDGDPHVWLSPELCIRQAETCARALAETDPHHAAEYQENLEALRAELLALDEEIHGILSPCWGRRMWVFHPAWGYFAHAFGLEQAAIEIEGKEPSEAELTGLLERAREDRVTTIFVQPQVRGRTAERVAEVLGAKIVRIDPLARDVPRNLRAVAHAVAEAMR